MSTDHSHMPHARAAELLPWLVNGTLEGEERSAVLEHARSCVACRRDLAELENMHAEMAAAAARQPSLPEPGARRVQAVLRQAKRTPVQRALARIRGRRRSDLGPFGLAAQPLRAALLAQSALVIVLVAALVAVLVLPNREPPAYTTLTTNEELPPGRYMRVVIHPDAGETAVAELLQRHELTVVEGPSDRGVYTFALSVPSDNAWRRAASALEDEAVVLFVQPIAVEDPP